MKIALFYFLLVVLAGCSTPGIAEEDFYPGYLESKQQDRVRPEKPLRQYEDLGQPKNFDVFISDLSEELLLDSVRKQPGFPEVPDQYQIQKVERSE